LRETRVLVLAGGQPGGGWSGGGAGPHDPAGNVPVKVTAQTSVVGPGFRTLESKSPRCPDAADTKVTGVEDIS